MGGYGSTRWGSHSKKNTVGDGLVLSMRPLLKLIKDGREWPELLTWSQGERKWAEISVALEPADDFTFLRFKYSAGSGENKRDVAYLVEIVSAPLPKGGLKWYFLCPGQGGTCRRRCSKLYTGPGSALFACRECHGLTYSTSQESHKYSAMAETIARRLGTTTREIERAFRKR